MKSLGSEKNTYLDGPFSFQDSRFHMEPKAPLHMPAYNKGNVIRGGFGNTFRRIVGHGNHKDRVRDRARGRKPRSKAGDTPVAEGSEKINKNRDIPRPVVIEPLFETVETCSMGRLLFGGLTLCDKGDNLCSDVTT